MRALFSRENLPLVIPTVAVILLVGVTIAPGTNFVDREEPQIEVLGSTQLKQSTTQSADTSIDGTRTGDTLPFLPTEDLFTKITPNDAPSIGQAAPGTNIPKTNAEASSFSQSVQDESPLDDATPNTRLPDSDAPAHCTTQTVVINDRTLEPGQSTEPVSVSLECERYDVVLTTRTSAPTVGQSDSTWYVEGRNADDVVVYASPDMIGLGEGDSSMTATVQSADLRHVATLRAVRVGESETADAIGVSVVLAPVTVAESSCTSAVPASLTQGEGSMWTAELDLTATECVPEDAVMTGWVIAVEGSHQQFFDTTLDRVSFTLETFETTSMVLYPTIEVDGVALPFGSVVASTELGS